MHRFFTSFLFSLITLRANAQGGIARPKLVVGIVVDQMRWDYLYRYYDRYDEKGGFKRMLKQGFSCENTLIPYTPTYTGCGHSSIYTGSVPALTGIAGNYWWDRNQMRSVYCTEDKSVQTTGSSSAQGQMSPRNMLTTTISDELKLATAGRSKVIGVAIKDRGAILPAGHGADAAYWYDNSVGKFISSSYYMKELPGWVNTFNAQGLVDKYYKEGWRLLYPLPSYIQSTVDRKPYEANTLGKNTFPYDSLVKYAGKDYSKISTTPMGNSLTLAFAKAALDGEKLGADAHTDLLAISFSSPDYIGHSYGPNSVESEDGFLRLDRELGQFLDYLDTKVGKGQYTVFLSADHGVAHTPEFMQENKMPGGRLFMNEVTKKMNTLLQEQYKVNRLVVYDDNYQVSLNHPAIDSAKLDVKAITRWVVDYLAKDSAVATVFPLEELNKVPLPGKVREMLNNGYFKQRSGDIQLILKPNYIDAFSSTGTTHGLWNPYDAHIPLLWYGWGIKPGKTNRTTYMTDIAPTLAALLRIQEPNGSVGEVIMEVMK